MTRAVSAQTLAAFAPNASRGPDEGTKAEPMNDPVVAVCVPLDDSNDPAVLADVIAFLDGFDEAVHFDKSELTPTSASPRVGADRRGSRAAEENRARVERYWRKKDELSLLRKQVAYLTGTLERMKRATGVSLEVKSANGLLVTVGRARDSHGGDWKHRLDRERELRLRAEKTNAQLREVLRTHELWRCGLSKKLQGAWPSSMEVRQLHSRPTAACLDCVVWLLGGSCVVGGRFLGRTVTLRLRCMGTAWPAMKAVTRCGVAFSSC
jgi:hypothetical protein